MRVLSLLRAALAAIAVALTGAAPGCAPAPPKADRTYEVTLDAEKDYFAQDWVQIIAPSKAKGEVLVDSFDVTIRRTRAITVPGDAGELLFRTKNKNITAKLKLTADGGRITVRPLSDKGSSAGIGWMLGRRGGVELTRLVVEFAK